MRIVETSFNLSFFQDCTRRSFTLLPKPSCLVPPAVKRATFSSSSVFPTQFPVSSLESYRTSPASIASCCTTWQRLLPVRSHVLSLYSTLTSYLCCTELSSACRSVSTYIYIITSYCIKQETSPVADVEPIAAVAWHCDEKALERCSCG